jgi:hypothetical protein
MPALEHHSTSTVLYGVQEPQVPHHDMKSRAVFHVERVASKAIAVLGAENKQSGLAEATVFDQLEQPFWWCP